MRAPGNELVAFADVVPGMTHQYSTVLVVGLAPRLSHERQSRIDPSRRFQLQPKEPRSPVKSNQPQVHFQAQNGLGSIRQE